MHEQEAQRHTVPMEELCSKAWQVLIHAIVLSDLDVACQNRHLVPWPGFGEAGKLGVQRI